ATLLNEYMRSPKVGCGCESCGHHACSRTVIGASFHSCSVLLRGLMWAARNQNHAISGSRLQSALRPNSNGICGARKGRQDFDTAPARTKYLACRSGMAICEILFSILPLVLQR